MFLFFIPSYCFGGGGGMLAGPGYQDAARDVQSDGAMPFYVSRFVYCVPTEVTLASLLLAYIKLCVCVW